MSICTIATGFKKEFNGYQVANELQKLLPSIEWDDHTFKPELNLKEVDDTSIRVNFKGEQGGDCYISIAEDKKGLCACTYARRSPGASAIQEIVVFDMIKHYGGIAFYDTAPYNQYFYDPEKGTFEEKSLDETL